MNILKASVRALKAISLFLVRNGPRLCIEFKPGWSLSAGIYRTDSDFALGVNVTLLEHIMGPLSGVVINLGWLSIQVGASYGYE